MLPHELPLGQYQPVIARSFSSRPVVFAKPLQTFQQPSPQAFIEFTNKQQPPSEVIRDDWKWRRKNWLNESSTG